MGKTFKNMPSSIPSPFLEMPEPAEEGKGVQFCHGAYLSVCLVVTPHPAEAQEPPPYGSLCRGAGPWDTETLPPTGVQVGHTDAHMHINI